MFGASSIGLVGVRGQEFRIRIYSLGFRLVGFRFQFKGLRSSVQGVSGAPPCKRRLASADSDLARCCCSSSLAINRQLPFWWGQLFLLFRV